MGINTSYHWHIQGGFKRKVPLLYKKQANKTQGLSPITPMLMVSQAFAQSQKRGSFFKTKPVITSHLLHILLKLKHVKSYK